LLNVLLQLANKNGIQKQNKIIMVSWTPLNITNLLFNLFFNKSLIYVFLIINSIKLGAVTMESGEASGFWCLLPVVTYDTSGCKLLNLDKSYWAH
jgi:hypothetical protein